MSEGQSDPDDQRILDHAFEALADGPRSTTELIAQLGAAGAFEHMDDADDDVLEELLLDVVTTADRVWVHQATTLHRTDVLLEGVVLTHRLTEREVERGGIEIEPDLSVMDFGIGWGNDLVIDGQVVETSFDLGESWHAWVLPEGLPAECEAGCLIGLRREGSTLSLLTDPDLAAETEAADTGELRAHLAAILERAGDTGIGFESTRAVMDLLCELPGALRSPAPPVSELLTGEGASRQGHFFGPGNAEWELPGARYLRARRERLFDRWDFGECCEEAFQVVEDAWQAHLLGQDPQRSPAEIRSALAHSAVSLAVLDLWEEQGVVPEQVEPFLTPAIDTTRRDAAPALFMLGVILEGAGRPLEAERRYQEATVANSDFVPPTEALGLIAFERGDLDRAISLLDRTAEPGRRHPLSELLAELVVPVAAVGRNDPCPCGSGRKYKVCHRGRSLDGESERAKLLLHKALVHLHRHGQDVLEPLIAGYEPDQAPQVEDDFVVDVALFEGGVFARFLDERAPLLPPGDIAEGQVWLATPRRLYEVVDAEPGVQLTLRDLTSGDLVVVEERLGSTGRQAGEYLLGRVVRPDSEPSIIGNPILVPMHSRQSLLSVLDMGGDPEDLVGWYAATTAPPRLQNRSGHDLVFCETTVDPGVDSAEAVETGLDGCFGPSEPESETLVWHWGLEASGGVPGERLIAGRIALEDGRLACSTNSVERADELLELLRSAFPDMTVDSDVRTPLDEMPRPETDESGLIDPTDAPPEVQEALREYMRSYEESWIDESIPALDDMTPREAAADPTRREDVERLLAGMPTDPDGLMMDPDRMREMLGLDRG